jgi:hypothetical protein
MATYSQTDLSQAGYLSLVRWYALGGHDVDRQAEILFGYKFKNGTVALAAAMLDDSTVKLQLNTVVQEIEQGTNGVHVATDGGQTISARACIVATPSGCWADLKFSPPLSEGRLRVSRANSLVSTLASNTQVTLKGESRRFQLVAPVGSRVGMIYTIRKVSDDVQVAQLDATPAFKDPKDEAQWTDAIKELLPPHVEINDIRTEWYLQDDPLTRGGWSMYHAGVLTREEPHVRLAVPEGRVAFATSDISEFWHSFIDGAIESGIKAAGQVRSILGVHPVPARP